MIRKHCIHLNIIIYITIINIYISYQPNISNHAYHHHSTVCNIYEMSRKPWQHGMNLHQSDVSHDIATGAGLLNAFHSIPSIAPSHQPVGLMFCRVVFLMRLFCASAFFICALVVFLLCLCCVFVCLCVCLRVCVFVCLCLCCVVVFCFIYLCRFVVVFLLLSQFY